MGAGADRGLAALTNPLCNSGVRTLLPVLVPKHLWPRVNAVDANSFVLAQLVGPPLAGVIIQVAGPLVGLASIGGMLGVAADLHDRHPGAADGDVDDRPAPPRRAQRAACTSCATRRCAALAISMSTLRFGSGIQAIVMPVIVLTRLDAGPVVVGLAWGISAVAGFVAALIFGRDRHRRPGAADPRLLLGRHGRGHRRCCCSRRACRSSSLAMAVTGFLNGPADVTMFTLRQRRTDPAWFGRAFAVSASFNFAGYPLGSAIAGAIVELCPRAGDRLAMLDGAAQRACSRGR